MSTRKTQLKRPPFPPVPPAFPHLQELRVGDGLNPVVDVLLLLRQRGFLHGGAGHLGVGRNGIAHNRLHQHQVLSGGDGGRVRLLGKGSELGVRRRLNLLPIRLVHVLGGIFPTKGRGVVGNEVELLGYLTPDGVRVAALDIGQGQFPLRLGLGLGGGRSGDSGASSGLGGNAHATGGLDALADLGGDRVGGGEEEGRGGGEGHEGEAEGLREREMEGARKG